MKKVLAFLVMAGVFAGCSGGGGEGGRESAAIPASIAPASIAPAGARARADA